MNDDPRIDPADLRQVKFPGSGRRYDARAVDEFLETVAARVAATNAMVDELQQRQVSQPAAAPAPADLSAISDEDLVHRLGEETAAVLLTARRSAEKLRRDAQEEAARALEEAASEIEQRTSEARARADAVTKDAVSSAEQVREEATRTAEEIVRQATEDAERVRAERQAEIDRRQAALEDRLAGIDAEAAKILVDAREEARAMVIEAREARTRMLEDLRRRREQVEAEIARLLNGRDRLLAAYDVVRENLDAVTAHISGVSLDAGGSDGFTGAVGEPPAFLSGAGASSTSSVGKDPSGTVDDTLPPTDAPGPSSWSGGSGRTGDEGTDASADPPVDAPAGVTPDAEPDDSGAGFDSAGALDEVSAPPVPVPDVERPSPPEADADEPVAEPAPVSTTTVEPEHVAEQPAPQPTVAEPSPSPTGADSALERAEQPSAPQSTVDRLPQRELHGGAVAQVAPAFLAGEEDIRHRAEVLAPVLERLERALKRELADEQNEVLDLLRREGAAASLLPDRDHHVARYRDAARPMVVEAAAAGSADPDVPGDVAALADDLAFAVVEPLRRRVEELAAEAGGDAESLDERLRAVYREVKVHQIAPSAEDALLSAYARGTLAGAGDAATVRWLIDPAQGPCPDALDNALQGFVVAGRPFPTGHVCPQAHPGCRCLLEVD